jgi:hypothetical protein
VCVLLPEGFGVTRLELPRVCMGDCSLELDHSLGRDKGAFVSGGSLGGLSGRQTSSSTRRGFMSFGAMLGLLCSAMRAASHCHHRGAFCGRSPCAFLFQEARFLAVDFLVESAVG